MTGRELAEKIILIYQTRDVAKIAADSGLEIETGKWFPATYGEFYVRTGKIIVNENAPIDREKIIAHELGHYFVGKMNIQNIGSEEKFCDEFAEELLSLTLETARAISGK